MACKYCVDGKCTGGCKKAEKKKKKDKKKKKKDK